MDADRRGRLLVGLQLVATAGHLWPGRRRWRLPWPVAMAAGAVTLAGAALCAAGALRLGPWLRPTPEPAPQAPLHRDGAYGLVRHPIYTGVLAMGAGGAVLRARPEPLVAWLALAAVMGVKSVYEERLLRRHHGPRYEAYQQEVPRFLPRWPAA